MVRENKAETAETHGSVTSNSITQRQATGIRAFQFTSTYSIQRGYATVSTVSLHEYDCLFALNLDTDVFSPSMQSKPPRKTWIQRYKEPKKNIKTY
jgi:hypothetical protein